MKPRKMRPEIMWAVVRWDGEVQCTSPTREKARAAKKLYYDYGDPPFRVVRVRVTEAP